MTVPRCPDCDIEMDCEGERHTCPLCGGHGVVSYAHSPARVWVSGNDEELRELMLEAMALIIKAVEERPEHAQQLQEVYRVGQELLEGDTS